MKLKRGLLPLLAFLSLSVYGFAQDGQDTDSHNEELNEKDFVALREYLKTKREIPLEEKDEHLSISGDVRFEWRHMNESQSGNSLRGGKKANPFTGIAISRNDFDCEFNLKFDYILDKTWAVAHLQYDNSAGVDSQDIDCKLDREGFFGSGRCDDLWFKKAYCGYSFWDNPSSRFDVEIGSRGNLYYAFDSRVQFLSRLDGIVFKYEASSDLMRKYYAKLAGFVVDERVNHFAWATEVGAIDIMESGIDLKYSFIDWMPHARGRCGKIICKDEKIPPVFRNKAKFIHDPLAFQFYVSQWTAAYNFDPELFCGVPVKAYGAFLMNHGRKYAKVYKGTNIVATPFNEDLYDKKGKPTTRIKANLGWYVGVLIGEVEKEGDWSVEAQYQYVEALCMPEMDEAGISRGNVLGESFTQTGRGFTNYKGWKVEALYAITNELSLDAIVEASKEANRRLGGRHRYSKVELEAIYAF